MEENITNNIKAQNQNIEVLKKHFGQCFDKSGNFDFEKFKQELSENEIDFYKESYGIDWLGKSYARVLASDPTTTLLKEDEEFNSREENKDSKNLLIKGDNLEVLKHLTNAYYEKVKVIYIDPPYNTGSDGFVYQDDRKFTVSELQELAGVSEEKATRILEFTQSHSNSHSAWLTFMYPRLYIAKQLLREDGAIIISIDDHEIAQLRLLMDEIFGEENFLGETVWQHSVQPKGYSGKFSVHHNYNLVYRKSESFNLKSLERTDEHNKNYSNPDNDPNGLWRSGDVRNSLYRPNLIYDIKTPSGKIISPPEKGWRWSKETLQSKIETGEIIFSDDEERIIRKIYLKNVDGRTPETIWFGEEVGVTRDATNEIKSLFDDQSYFETPKPTGLIKRIAELTMNEEDIMMDFFAGSGTTGEAIYRMNYGDQGKRKFILVQLPEMIDSKNNANAYKFVKNQLNIDTPTIFDLTKERLIRSVKKILDENVDTPERSEKINCDGIHGEHCPSCKGSVKIKIDAKKAVDLTNFDLGFKVFETTPIWEDYGFDSKELSGQTKLFDETKLNEEDLKALLITWKTFDGSLLTEQTTTYDFKGYSGHYVNNKLYLMDKGFSTDNLTCLLEKIDSDKNFNPTSIIAFGYHFESKNLREISENIKSYANKKNIDIDFITRY